MHKAIGGFIRRRLREMTREELARPAVVLAPHPDDETLGCGGTLIRKARAGAPLKVVLMTDGARSGRGLIDEDEIVSLRRGEAKAAAELLGLDPDSLVFLEFPDGKLDSHRQDAISRLTEILTDELPEQVFLPYARDAHADHRATHRIAGGALERWARPVEVFEYPIWLWNHWPWVRSVGGGRLPSLGFMRESAVAAACFAAHFRSSVYIGDVREQKRAALEKHRSQMTRLVDDPRWRTLPEVAGGDFLSCFFGDHELFRRRSVGPGR